MAPIPEKNQDKPADTNNDDSDINSFSNANVSYYGVSGSSEDEEIYENSAFGGYTLLPQDPDDDDDGNDDQNTNADQFVSADIARENEAGASCIDNSLPEAVLDFEMNASAPSVTVTNDSCHPAFLAKFLDGKIPSYLQVAAISKDKENHLWNQKSQDARRLSLDSAQETKILGAMSGFSLPKESIPDWAKNLTDDQWQFQMLKHIGVSRSSEKDHSEDPSSSTPWVAEFSETEKDNAMQ